MKTMFVLPSLSRAGAESQLIGLVNGLGRSINYKGVFCFDANVDQRSNLASETHFFHLARQFKLDLRPAIRLARILEQEEIDVIHCTLPISLLVASIARTLSRKKPRLIAALHTTINKSAKAEFFDRTLYRRLLASCDAVVCVCDAQFEYWGSKFPFLKHNGCVIHNGIDVDHFTPASDNEERKTLRRELDIGSDRKVIAHVAAFRPEKGHAILIEAFKSVVREIPEAILVFAGDGPLRPMTERIATECGLSNHMRFLGNLSDVRPVLRAADVSVLASTSVETFSMAMLESLAMEVPMVATDLGGTREAVLDGVTGYVVQPGDPAALGNALIAVLKQDGVSQRMGKSGRRLISDRYTAATMVQMTERLLLSLSQQIKG
jgi:glycosyltransferase involved in cell wall biosynthesis